MAPLSLKIILDEGAVTRTVKFESNTKVADAHALIKEKILTADDGKEYALFLTSADDDRSGVWLEPHRPLDYYMLRDGDSLLYLHRHRTVRVRTLDGSVKTLQVDESKNVGTLMMIICGRLGITNYEEYGLCQETRMEEDEAKENRPSVGTLTLKRKAQQRERDAKMHELSKKLKTDDNVDWLDQHKTLREEGIDPSETLLLKRRLFYSDRNVDARDPVQLNLLYVQTRDAILNGRHPVTEAQAMEFAAIQCQIHFGDYQEEKHKPGLIENLKEYLPEQYETAWGAEKKILKLFSKHQGLSQLEAKHLYNKTARDLPTYGVTFFVVKEKQKAKKKLVPRLLGINSESILRLDEVTKEILQAWPLTHVKTYQAGKNDTFTLNFGDYSDNEYSVKTNDAHRIREILEGYIDIIRKRLCGPSGAHYTEGGIVEQEDVHVSRGNVMTHVTHKAEKIVQHSYVGPSKLLPFEQGAKAQSGTQMMTVQQVIVTRKGSTTQQVVAGEVPLRGDMSQQLVKKLNRTNANAVKIVTLLAEPSQANIEEARNIMNLMEEDLPIIQSGVKEAAEKQDSEEKRSKLLKEIAELNALLAGASQRLRQQDVKPEEVQDVARQIADLTTQMYFSLDPRTQRRSQLVRSSRASFISDEQTAGKLRRASYIAAAGSTAHALTETLALLQQEYRGPELSAIQVERLEANAVDKLGKLNAAVALFLTAHADPKSPDYDAAVTSMNTIRELMPELVTDAIAISHAKGGAEGEAIMSDVRALLDAAHTVCALHGTDDHQKVVEASQAFSEPSGRLVYAFGAGNPRINADKENELMGLAQAVGDATTRLLVQAHEVAQGAPDTHNAHAQNVDDAGVACAHRARDLLAVAQLTTPCIREPHCQSALTAAAEALSGGAQRLGVAWKPLAEAPEGAEAGQHLAARTMELAKALDALKQAYSNLGPIVEEAVPPAVARRLQFTAAVEAARGGVRGAIQQLDQPITRTSMTDSEINALQDKISDNLARSNAAVAALLQATADPQNPDYDAAETAVGTIGQVTADVVKDVRAALSGCADERARAALLADVRAWCRAADHVCAGASSEHHKELDDAAKDYAKASRKLSFVFSPLARKAREQLMMELFNSAHKEALKMAETSDTMADQVGGAGATTLRALGADLRDTVGAMHTAVMVSSPSLESAACRSALESSSATLAGAAQRLTHTAHELQDGETGCRVLSSSLAAQRAQLVQHGNQLQQAIAAIRHTLRDDYTHTDKEQVETPSQRVQRLRFITSAAAAGERAREAEELIDRPVENVKLSEEQVKALEEKRARELAAVNAAIAMLINAKNDRVNPDYDAAKHALETVSDLVPEIINDTRALSAMCGDDKARAAVLQQIRAWSDAVRAVCASAHTYQLQDFVDSAQHFADTTEKLNFVFTPRKPSSREEQAVQLSSAARDSALAMVSAARATAGALPAPASAPLRVRTDALEHAARTLATTARLTAPSLDSPTSQAALVSAGAGAESAADGLVLCAARHEDPRCQELASSMEGDRELMRRALAGLRTVCADNTVCVETPAQKTQRLKFIKSAAAARDKAQEVDKLLDVPIESKKLSAEQVESLEEKRARELAAVNAAIALLIKVKTDRQNPDYQAAEQAIETVSDLMPEIINDTRALTATCADEATRADTLREVRAWSDAVRAVCASAQHTDNKEFVDSAQHFADTTNKLHFVFKPHKATPSEEQVVKLSTAVCDSARKMAHSAQQTVADLPADCAVQLRTRTAALQDATQALSTTAQLTGGSIHEPSSRAALWGAGAGAGEAADQLYTCAEHSPHPKGKELATKLEGDREELHLALVRLQAVCDTADTEHKETPAQKTQRLKFIKSAAAARDKAQEVDKLLDMPLGNKKLNEDQIKALEEKRARELAALNAAIAMLLNAKYDPRNPNYEAAEQAIETVTDLMPEIIQDTRALSATCADDKTRARTLQEIRAWSDAVRAVCASAQHTDHKGFVDSAQHFADTTNKLNFVFKPHKATPREEQVVQLSQAACAAARRMSMDATHCARRLPPRSPAAAPLRARSLALDDAIVALHTTTRLTAPTLDNPSSRSLLRAAGAGTSSAAGELITTADDLHDPVLAASLHAEREQLVQALAGILAVCDTVETDAEEKAAKEKQRLKFLASLEAVREKLEDVPQILNQPAGAGAGCGDLSESQLLDVSERAASLAGQVHAAAAALLTHTLDEQNPDHLAAAASLSNISDLLPQIAKDSVILNCKNKESAEATKEWFGTLSDMCTALADGEAQQLEKAIQAMTAAAAGMKFLTGNRRKNAKEFEVLASANKVSHIAGQMAADTLSVRSMDSARFLQQTAHALRTAAQATAGSIHDSSSQSALLGSAELVQAAAAHMRGAVCAGGGAGGSGGGAGGAGVGRLAETLAGKDEQLKVAVEEFRGICTNPKLSPRTMKAQQEKFAAAVADADLKAVNAEKLLDQPPVGDKLNDQQTKDVQQKLSRAMAQVNAAVAALVRANSDPQQPDYEEAEKSLATISEILPKVIEESVHLSTTCAEAGVRADMLADTSAWSRALRGACVAAARGADGGDKDLTDAAVKFSAASQKLRFVVTARQNPVKEQQIMQLSNSACDKARQMCEETRRVAGAVGARDATMMRAHAAQLHSAADALQATAQLTAPTIHEPHCQAALVSSADEVCLRARTLVRDTARAEHPAARRLSEEADRYRDILTRALQELKRTATAEDKRRGAPPPPPKRSSLSRAASGGRRASGTGVPGVPQSPRVRVVSHSDGRRASQDWLDNMREDASKHLESSPTAGLSSQQQAHLRMIAEEEARSKEQYYIAADTATQRLQENMKKLQTLKPVGPLLDEQQQQAACKQVELRLAAVGASAGDLVAATRPGETDYPTAAAAVKSLTEHVADIIKDGELLSKTRDEKTNRSLLENIRLLSEAARRLIGAGRHNHQDVNEAALSLGDRVAALMYAVAPEVDPAQEKLVISRARAIGDLSFALAERAAGAVGAGPAGAAGGGVCDAGRRCAGNAHALVYTAKLVAPSIHHQQNANSLITRSHELSTTLKDFSNSWKPLQSDPKHSSTLTEMTSEAQELERQLEEFRQDLAAGKLVRRREEEILIEDTPLRQLASQIMELAQMRSECGRTADNKKRLFGEYAGALRAALRALDRARTRAARTPSDITKLQELENAVQNLQMTLLQTRPSLGDAPHNNVVDLTDFVKDTSKEADKLLTTANTLKTNEPDQKKLEVVKNECHQINLTAFRLLNPAEQLGDDDASLHSILEVDQFGQQCEKKVRDIKKSIEGFKEDGPKAVLQENSLALIESCGFLRFATKSALATAQSASLDETMDDLTEMAGRLDRLLAPTDTQPSGVTYDAWSLHCARTLVLGAAAGAARGRGGAGLPPALASYVAEMRARTDLRDKHCRERTKEHLSKVIGLLQQLIASSSVRVATWQPLPGERVAALTQKLMQELNNAPSPSGVSTEEAPLQAVNEEEINKLLMPLEVKMEGEPKVLEQKLQQAASKLIMLSDTLAGSAARGGGGGGGGGDSLDRTAPALANTALQLAAAARALPAKNISQAQRTEEIAQEMCWCTYKMIMGAQLAARGGAGGRGALRDATATLLDQVNKLVRVASTGDRLSVECGELTRTLQAAAPPAPPAPRPAPPYPHCLQALDTQRDVILKLNKDEPLPRAEFCQTLHYVTTAVCNSAESAAQCAYLITLSEHHLEAAREGLVDAPRMQRMVTHVSDACYTIVRASSVDSAKEETLKVSRINEELQAAVKEGSGKAKDPAAKRELTECGFKLELAVNALHTAAHHPHASVDKTSVCALSVVECGRALNTALQRPALMPAPTQLSDRTKTLADQVVAGSKKLISKTQALIKEVRAADDDEDPMTWVTYNTQRKDVVQAFNELREILKRNGESCGLVKVAKEAEEEPEVPVKTYIQIQEEVARKWLQRRPSDAGVARAGQQAATALVDVAQDMVEDLKGHEKEEMLNLITECRELVEECSKKYDNDRARLLSGRLHEMRRAVERGAVTSVVEQLLDGVACEDLDLMLDAERDEAKRKLLLERKIAELMSQLGYVKRTARLVARTGRPPAQLQQCTQQVELLAPALVQAARQRAASDDAASAERFRVALAQYAAALKGVTAACDQAVDPLDFVQTAGETMARMREDSTAKNDPQLCAYTSNAITRLATRVIEMSMSSQVARSDPELRAALTEAQQKLAATVPKPGTRESRLPDWKDTTAEILRTTGEVESALGGENIFKKSPEPDQPIYNAALSLHSAVRAWSARDNEVVAVAKRMAVLMARLAEQMYTERKRELLITSKAIVAESKEVCTLADKLANECGDVRIRMNLLQVCERIPTISGQLKMLTTVKGSTLGNMGGEEDREAMNMLVTNAQNLMQSVQEVVKAAESASVKIASQRGLKWVRKKY